jgi:CheY-like chemotaxis protein
MRGVPVVFMTAKAMPDELEQLLQHGATGLIVKPFDPMTLPQDIRPTGSTAVAPRPGTGWRCRPRCTSFAGPPAATALSVSHSWRDWPWRIQGRGWSACCRTCVPHCRHSRMSALRSNDLT